MHKTIIKLEGNCSSFESTSSLTVQINVQLSLNTVQQSSKVHESKYGEKKCEWQARFLDMCYDKYHPETADIKWFHGVVVITLDFESGNPGSNPGGTYFFLENKNRKLVICH
uniref:Uncharacterized protein n=1 Tax=Arundo donax TaxID=35708 RepID=A0A0A8XSW2_ARUDO